MPPDAPNIFDDVDALLALACESMTAAARAAVAENDALGVPTPFGKDGKVMWRLPGGQIVSEPPDTLDGPPV